MKNIIISIILISLGFFSGYIVGAKKNIQTENGQEDLANLDFPSNKENDFEAGNQAVQDKAIEDGYVGEPDIVTSLSGVIKSIEGNKIVLETVLFNPSDDEKYKIRTIITSDETEIVSNTPILITGNQNESTDIPDGTEAMPIVSDEKNDQKEINNYEIKQELIKISDLKVGQNINVTAEEDIKYKIEFKALTIETNQALPVMN